MKRTRVIIELEWNKTFNTMEFREFIIKKLDQEPNLTAYSIYENP